MARISNAKLRHPFFQLRSSQQEQPVSGVTMAKHSRIRDAVAVDGVCPYCAVGCAQHIYVKGGQVVDIEGDTRSPINEGTLCPKGSNTFQLTVNPHRQQQTLYRAPYSDHWETVSLEWAMERIAQRVAETREATFREQDDEGNILNHTTAMAHLGGATLDNEENYLIKKLFNGLGMVAIENQARI
jgi:formate dehydrogenase major subunit